ncbi:MAG: DUF1700 domain-containing protein, partial [Clostridia bacterium]|nr:DUF1700 domain-containing protein [Clostridia bacterium]
MKKQEFLEALAQGLAARGAADREKTLDYYREMIEDRMEDGLSEEEAVAAMGSPADILAGIQIEAPPRKEKRAWRAWEIVLLALGSPIWGSLLLAAAAILFSLLVVLWSLVISAYAVNVSLAAVAVAGIGVSPVLLLTGQWPAALLLLGGGLFCTGAAIFAFFGCRAATRGSAYLVKQLMRGTKA